MVRFSIQGVSRHVRRILGNGDVCMYLVEGAGRALLVDTGYGIGDLRGFVEGLLATAEGSLKPYDVLLTHGHLDHAAGAGQFDRCYLNPADLGLYYQHADLAYRKEHVLGRNFTDFADLEDSDWVVSGGEQIVALEPGTRFDLGGVHVEVIAAPGHTPGMVVPVIVEDRLAMFGDACGVGTLVVEPFSSSVRTFLESIRVLKGREDAWDSVIREHGTFVSTKRVLDDNIELAERVLAGTDDAEETNFYGATVFRAAATNQATGTRTDGREGNLIYSRSLA